MIVFHLYNTSFLILDYTSGVALRLRIKDTDSNNFIRKKDSKHYLTASGYPSIKPETRFTFNIKITNYGDSQAKAYMTLTYVSAKTNESETFNFNRIINIPAGNPNDFKTRVGVGLYANRSEIWSS